MTAMKPKKETASDAWTVTVRQFQLMLFSSTFQSRYLFCSISHNVICLFFPSVENLGKRNRASTVTTGFRFARYSLFHTVDTDDDISLFHCPLRHGHKDKTEKTSFVLMSFSDLTLQHLSFCCCYSVMLSSYHR